MAFTNPDYLVTTDWLANHLDDPNVRVLDVTAKLTSKLENRAEAECYEQSHIPGSLFFDVASGKGVLSDQNAPLPWMWPDPKAFVATMAKFGVGPDTRVVLMAGTPRPGIDSGTMWCTRAWWTMHHFGVDCAILQGGLEKWQAEGRPLTNKRSTVATEVLPFTVVDGRDRARATKEDVVDAISDGSGSCLVDALPADSFDGSGTKYGPRGGHISGAVNVPFRSFINGETADFVEPDALRDYLTKAGLLGAPEVITYCGGAIAATVPAFVLALFGHNEVGVYDGSLMEWSADALLPMTTSSP